MNSTKLLEDYFEWWLFATARYVQWVCDRAFFLKGVESVLEWYLAAKSKTDRILEETWRNLGVPPLEEIVRIHERLNYLESLLLEQKDSAGSILTSSVNRGKISPRSGKGILEKTNDEVQDLYQRPKRRSAGSQHLPKISAQDGSSFRRRPE